MCIQQGYFENAVYDVEQEEEEDLSFDVFIEKMKAKVNEIEEMETCTEENAVDNRVNFHVGTETQEIHLNDKSDGALQPELPIITTPEDTCTVKAILNSLVHKTLPAQTPGDKEQNSRKKYQEIHGAWKEASTILIYVAYELCLNVSTEEPDTQLPELIVTLHDNIIPIRSEDANSGNKLDAMQTRFSTAVSRLLEEIRKHRYRLRPVDRLKANIVARILRRPAQRSKGGRPRKDKK